MDCTSVAFCSSITKDQLSLLLIEWTQYLLYMRQQTPQLAKYIVDSSIDVSLSYKKTQLKFIEQYNQLCNTFKDITNILEDYCELVFCLGNNFSIPSEFYHFKISLSQINDDIDNKFISTFLRKLAASLDFSSDLGITILTIFIKAPRGIQLKQLKPKQFNVISFARKKTKKYVFNITSDVSKTNDEYDSKNMIWYQFLATVKGLPVEKVKEDNDDWLLE